MIPFWGFPGSTSGKESACNVGEARDLGSILGGEDPLEKEMITHFSVFAWKIPWTEEPDRLLSMGSQRIWRDWETASTCMILFGQVPGSDHWVTENEPGRDLAQSFSRISLWLLSKRVVYICQQLLVYSFGEKNVEWKFDVQIMHRKW